MCVGFFIQKYNIILITVCNSIKKGSELEPISAKILTSLYKCSHVFGVVLGQVPIPQPWQPSSLISYANEMAPIIGGII